MQNKMDCKIRYEDNMKEEDYQKWCFNWFKESELKSKMVVFTPGYKNFNFWMKYINFEVSLPAIGGVKSKTITAASGIIESKI